jgi:hypothetical protein
LFSWIRQSFAGSDSEPFVLHYWDLRPPNIIIDNDGNLVA